jgi:hypothetical protein
MAATCSRNIRLRRWWWPQTLWLNFRGDGSAVAQRMHCGAVRQVIVGFFHLLNCGERSIDLRPDYGPCRTLCNRFPPWASEGVLVDYFHVPAGASNPPAQVLINCSAVKARHCACRGWVQRCASVGEPRGGCPTAIQTSTTRDRWSSAHSAPPADGLMFVRRWIRSGAGPASVIRHCDDDRRSNAIRQQTAESSTMPDTLLKPNRRQKGPFLARPLPKISSCACTDAARPPACRQPDTTVAPLTSSPQPASYWI